MRYLPIHVDVRDQPCVLVGGGEVAARKAGLLQKAGASITVVAPELCDVLCRQAQSGTIAWLAQPFVPSCLVGARLVVAATDNPAVNRAVATAADAQGVLVNVVDDPAHCSFIVPALIDRSPLVISVTSSGAAPVLATRVRRRIEASLPPAVAALAQFMGARRPDVKAALPAGPSRRAFWARFLDSHLPALLASEPAAAAAAFEAMLAGCQALESRVERVQLASADPLDLTLRTLALLGEAERIVHTPGVPAAVLDYARRDAEFIPIGEDTGGQPDSRPGLTLYLSIATN